VQFVAEVVISIATMWAASAVSGVIKW
jgi:hypothetical protein